MKTLTAFAYSLLLILVPGIQSNANDQHESAASRTVTLSAPLAVRNAEGVEVEREALKATLTTDGCSASCSGGTLFCSVQAPPNDDETFVCGCCDDAAGCMSERSGTLLVRQRPGDRSLNYDVVQVEAELTLTA